MTVAFNFINYFESFFDKKWNRYFAWFFIVGASFTLLFFHEPWRDELQALLIANNSNSIIELYKNTRYEGHPLIWFLILKIPFVFNQIFCIKIVHWIITSITTFIFIEYAKIKNSWKILIIFGYFFTYEYNILFRNYSVGILFLFLFMVLNEKKKTIWAVLSLFLAINTNFFAFVIGNILWFTFIAFDLKNYKKYILPSALLLIGNLIFLISIERPDDFGYKVGIHLWIGSLSDFYKTFFVALFNIPKISIQFWNTNIFNSLFQCILGILTFFYISFFFFKNYKKSFVFFFLATFALQLFFGIKFYGQLRHHGHFYIILIISFWLNGIFYPNKKETLAGPQIIFSTIFFIQIFATFIAYYMDFHYPFSNSKNAALAIENKYPNKNLYAEPDFAASGISYYIQKDIYYINASRKGSYVIWDTKRIDNYGKNLLIKRIDEIFIKDSRALVILNEPIQNNNYTIKDSFLSSINSDENYFFYSKK